jgi:serine/threonine protein phosphatase PrpC
LSPPLINLGILLLKLFYHLKGDTRAILQMSSSDGVSVISLSNDHKPNNEEELLRIQNAGGEVIHGLIEGRLAVSRGLGDFAFKHTPSVRCALDNTDSCSNIDDYVLPEKQMVTPVPEITFHCREPALDQFIAIACDGIWDVISSEKCAELISTIFNEGEQSTALVCEEVLDQCYAKGSLDNMTIILIKFPAQSIGVGGGVMKRRKQRLRYG